MRRKPFFALGGAIYLVLCGVFFQPAWETWCRHFEQIYPNPHNPAFINGYYALGIAVELFGIAAFGLAITSIVSLLRREKGCLWTLAYGVPGILYLLWYGGILLIPYVLGIFQH